MLRTELIRPLPEMLIEHASRFSGKTAFADARRSVSYSELELRTRRIAGHLAGLRVRPGDRAAIYLGNCVETVESYLAITRANAIGVPLNPHSTDAELEYFLADSGARVVITDPAHAEQVTRVVGDAQYPRVVVTGVQSAPAATVAFEALAGTEPEAAAGDDLDLDEVAWMLYTSGTTGKPKGVLSTQRNGLWAVAACYVPVPELTPDDRVLWPLPLFHSLSHIACVLAVTAVGATARITDGYSADEILSVLREESPTFLAGVPTMYHHLVQAAQQQGVRTGDLRIGLVGGAVTTQSLRSSFEETFGVPLLDAYGSTETSGAITINWPTGARVEGSCGLPVPGLNVRVVDPETGQDVPTGQEGEVWVSGPSVMVGYHNRPEETAAALRDGWYHTGDLARRDDAGYFTISGRIKEVIIRGGENIHPGEVEDVLRRVPGVADVAVAGKPHDILGEVPVAFLVPGEPGLDTDALFAACRAELSYFKVPEELYEVDRIPRTRSGKVTRHVLLDEPGRLRAAGSSSYESLFRTEWTPLSPAQTLGAQAPPAPLTWTLTGAWDEALAGGLESAGAQVTRDADGAAPADVTVLAVGAPHDDTSELGAFVTAVEAKLRSLLADGPASAARLAVLTRGGVPVDPADTPDPAHAAVAGLVRGLQAEHGDRLVLVDAEAGSAGDTEAGERLPTALAAGEPQLAVRAGSVVKPALEHLAVGGHPQTRQDTPLGPAGTVVIAGADTAAGAAMARHVVAGHGARDVLLIADHGDGDPAVAELSAELTGLRAAVTVAACDLIDRAALATALAGVTRPVSAVLYVPSGPVASVAAGVRHLDELTARGAGTTAKNTKATKTAKATKSAKNAKAAPPALILLGAADGLLGAAGEPADAAVAAYLDAYALRRRAQGRPTWSLSLGPWADDVRHQQDEPAPQLPVGVGTLSRRDLLAMIDAALMTGEALTLPMRLDALALHGDSVPALLRGLIDTSVVAANEGRAGEFRARLVAMPEDQQLRTLVTTVSTAAAEISGADDRVAPERAFKEAGFTSVQAVQLRNRLVEATGLWLPATLVFDYPTPRAVARFLQDELAGGTDESAEIVSAERADDDPVVIVGMACRLPGGIGSPEDLWTIVDEGLDGITGFPADRGWNLDELYDADPEQSGKSYVRDGGFLHDATGFDADFFRISPREALAMDPQQRVFLEASWELFERAGIDVSALHGSRTGVFAGVMNQDWSTGLADSADETEGYQSTGTAGSVVSGRVAYTFGFEGPAVTVDTACSSSLVALHLAGQSLRAGESDLAVAGGVCVMARPTSFIEFSRQRGLAEDGRCKAFAAGADGTGWSEGVAVVLLERLSDARRNGHKVLAVVAGSAVNQDGASNGLTAPNGPSQQRVIRQALASAGLRTGDVDMVEAHGTGTKLGDPIEAQAVINTYGKGRDAEHPLWLGSLKSNIGHTQTAAGVAGVIKSVLAMRHGVLPRTLHVDAPTPHVDWSVGSVELLTDAVEWPDQGRPRRAGVSAFGVSGTNAHVILEQGPAVDTAAEDEDDTVLEEPSGLLPWVLSAASAPALSQVARRLLDHVEGRGDLGAGEVAARLLGRARLDERAVVIGSDREELLRGLSALADDTADAGVVSGSAGVEGAEGRTVFVFPGQGTQWAGMGAGLLASSRVFAESVAEVEAALEPFVDWSLTDVIRQVEGAASLDRVDVVQPVSFAMMVSLARLWRHHGVQPDAVMGHSQGEIAAACVAGVLSLEDAARVVALRSQTIAGRLAGLGAMMSVPLPRGEVEEWLSRSQEYEGVEVATVNGPASVVVAGGPVSVDALHAALTEAGVRARKIPVDYASHTSHVDLIQDELATVLDGITAGAGEIPMYSSTDSAWVEPGQLGGEYWYRNLRQTVRFEAAVRSLADDGHHVFVEVSTHPVLTMAIEAILEERPDTLTAPTLRRDKDEPSTFLAALARLATHTDLPLDWHLPATSTTSAEVPLPTYPFQHQRYWPRPAPQAEAGGTVDPNEARFWEAVDQEDLAALTQTLDVTDPESRDALASALPALMNWRRLARRRSTADAWRYRVAWRRLGVVNSRRLNGTWLVALPAGFADDTRVTTALDALRAQGAECVLMEIGDTDRAALGAQLTAAGAPAAGYSAVLSFLSLDERPQADFPAVPTGLALLTALVPALADIGVTAPLWSVTTGGTDGPDGPETSPAQALTWGFGLVAALEYPKTWGGLVDLPAEPDEQALRQLSGVLRGQGDEDQIAIRGAGVFGRRLLRAPLDESNARRTWTPHGTVLLTGGTGGVGGQIARWLAGAGAEHLLLLSRRGPDTDGTEELVAELGDLGATVTVAACDVTDRDALATVIDGIPDEQPLTAVVHAAGLGQQSTIAETGPADFAHILTGKVAGADNLDAVLGDRPLDAFVLISSNAGVWGGGGQGAYAAANAYLDALALRRRSQGRTATSVAWGSWGGAGLGAVDGAAERLERLGVSAMDPQLAVAALVDAVERDETVLSVADIDWARFAPGFTAQRPSALLGELPEVQAALRELEGGRGADGAGSDLAARLSALPKDERETAVLTAVQSHVAAVLGHRDGAVVKPQVAFTDQGFDSMTAVQLRNALVRDFGLRLPATLIFDYPTPQALAGFVLGELAGEAAGAAQAVTAARVTDDDPIAIVSMACRLPGGVASPEDLWELLTEGREAQSDFPTDRGWDIDAIFDPAPGLPGKTYTRRGGFLDTATRFDPAFFRISPREALGMDPQQRVFLEASWEVIERAGIDVGALHGSRTGVFAGAFHTGYTIGADVIAEGVDGYTSHNNLPSVLSGRVSYTFGFEGPAVTVDTACSSSLVALHLAAQSLRAGESDLAVAGGVCVMVRPSTFIEFSRQRGLAEDGRCKAFAAGADGTGWSEGVAVVLLERLSDARRNGHHVLATVKATALNQDGASNGLTAPNGPSQQRVIRQALANAGLNTGDVDMVEAHGTGTVLGDPIEAQALINTYGQGRDSEHPLWLGSLKSNIGHAQTAAGMAGVIKSVLAMRHGVLPKTLHVDAPTPHVDWSAGAVELLTDAVEWPDQGRPRRAGISAFGVSGTNAHVILEQGTAAEDEATATGAQSPAGEPETVDEQPAQEPAALPWVLSAASPSALPQVARRLLDHVEGRGDLGAVEVAARLLGRARLDERAVVVGSDRDELLRALAALAEETADASVVTGSAGVEGRTVFVFPGQGTQWAGMGAGLLASSPVFAQSVAEIEAALEPYVDWSLTDVIRQVEGAASLDRVDVVQPVSFAMMVSLARLWRHHGVQPDAVMGHSQGEIAAACVAGVLSLDDAVRVVALRSQAIAGRLAGFGAMMSVPLALVEVEEWLTRSQAYDGVEVATVNGPASVVVAGGPNSVDALHTDLTEAGVRARKIPVDYASHTSHVERIQAELATLLDGITAGAGEIPMYSSTDSAWVEPGQLGGEYWYRNLRQTVRFEDAVRQLAEEGHHVFIESSTHPVLTMAIEAILEDRPDMLAAPTLRREKDEPTTFLAALARLATHTDLPVDWHQPALAQNSEFPLPTYPFQHQRYWLKTGAAASTDIGAVGLGESGHPMLGAVVQLPDSDGVVFTNRISVTTHPWLADHVISGTVLVPGTALLELVVRAGDETGAPVVSELVIEAPLVLPDQGSTQLRVVVGELDPDGRRSVAVHSRPDDAPWTRHVTGVLSSTPQPPPAASVADWPPAGAESGSAEEFYDTQRAAGFEFGELFRGLRAVWTKGEEVYAEVGLPEDVDLASDFLLHPALLDAALHAAAFLPGRTDTGRLPFAWSGVAVHATGATELRVHITKAGPQDIAVEITDATGAPVASVAALSMRPVDVEGLAGSQSVTDMLFRTDWTALALPAQPVQEAQPHTVVDLTALDETADAPDELPQRARALVNRALAGIQVHLAEPDPDGPLFVLTRDARRDPAMAAVWGLARTAQSEHPGQIVLVDLDGTDGSRALLPAAAATGEPQLALHDGAASMPRLTRHRAGGAEAPALDPDGTVLITGGTGTLGALVARRLVTDHGVRHLLLTSRRGPEAPDADALRAELTALGATVTLTACDIGDRAAVTELVTGVPAEHPLTAVIHSAAVLDDGVVTALEPERVDKVFGPKVDGAWHLHTLTKDLGLAAFVLFSSASGTLGNAGQGNYAAANGFLDGLAEYRRGLGLPATSMVWGLWEEASEMTGGLLDGSQGHLKQEVLAMTNDEGMRLFDAALGGAGLPDAPAVVVPIKLNLAALRQATSPPAVLAALVRHSRPTARQAAAGTGSDSFLDQLRRLPAAEQSKKLLDMVLMHTSATLGHNGSGAIHERQAFQSLGFDSLAAVDLRNRIAASIGLRLPATLVFDYPNPTALADQLREQLGITEEPAADRALAELHKFESALEELLMEADAQTQVAARLRKLAAKWQGPDGDTGADLELASDDDIFRLAEAELDQS